MTERHFYPPLSPFATGIRSRCPRCGDGALFDGYINLAPGCSACGLDYEFIDAGDGPAVFVILLIGFIVVGLALITEVAYRPPIWAHMTMWIPLTLVLSLGILRPLKAIMIAAQYQNNAREGRLDG